MELMSPMQIGACLLHFRHASVPVCVDLMLTTGHRLLIVNGISLGFALIANGSLLSNMSGRVSFEIAQPITIVGFFLAAFLLIALVVAANTSAFELDPPQSHTLTQAYYYACFAGGVYFIVAVLMTGTVIGALRGKYEKKFNLTTSQRTLMLQTISFLVYLMVGALIYEHLEGWRYLDALYFADFTLLTIGIGDNFVPMTHAGRSILFPYAIGGVVAVGLIVGSIRSMILDKGSKKMHARAVERKRRNVRSVEHYHESTVLGIKKRSTQKQPFPATRTERQRRKREFEVMRDVQRRADRTSRYVSLLLSVMAVCILWFIGGLVFQHCEYDQGWSYFLSLYFAYTSLLTIGYGDIAPQSNAGKAFFVFWSLLAIPALTILISNMGDTVVKGVAEATNYLGSFTLLPTERGIRRELKMTIHKMTGGIIFNMNNNNSDALDKNAKAHERDDQPTHEHHGTINTIMRRRMHEDDIELKEVRSIDPDTHFYHFLLVSEIANVLADSKLSPSKRYTYDEWAYFLRLLGHDENNPYMHRRQANRAPQDRTRLPDGRFEPEVGHITDREGQLKAWSWLGIRSPLMSGKEEAEWVMHQLLDKLQREMRWVGGRGADGGIEPRAEPPIVLSKLKEYEQNRRRQIVEREMHDKAQ